MSGIFGFERPATTAAIHDFINGRLVSLQETLNNSSLNRQRFR